MALQLKTLPPVSIDLGGTAKPITGSAIYSPSITIQAEYTNVGKISIGGEDVTPDNGIICAPGESAVIEFPASAKQNSEFDLAKIYVVSASAGDKVRIVYIKRE